jgi:predicted nucleotidyltransferase
METPPLHTNKRAVLYSVWVFGSYLRCSAPRDLDLLVVYTNALSAGYAVNLRSEVTNRIRKYTSLPVHTLLLSEREESELQFIATEGCRPLTNRDLEALQSLGF